MRNKIVTIAIILAVIFGLYKLFSVSPTTGSPQADADLVLYWGIGCPHCEKVKEYIQSNRLDQKLKIAYKEVYYNKQNQADLQATVKKCPEIDTTQGVGVPLAFIPVDQRCLSGDTPIISFLEAKTGIK